jgi:hypothetical protein
MSQELATIQEEQTTLLSVEGADHNNLFLFEEFSQSLQEALRAR